ncbi:MAG: hypothetical protein KBF17_04850 [Candidatus Promineofilum sp.]|nr:hypothetical protein [Promineifilum sp.]MBP9656237.1 hypothetical protein [Promineifilum sp.]
MTVAKMHADELEIDVPLTHLPLSPIPSSGTDHALFRLGEESVDRQAYIKGNSFQDKVPHLAHW